MLGEKWPWVGEKDHRAFVQMRGRNVGCGAGLVPNRCLFYTIISALNSDLNSEINFFISPTTTAFFGMNLDISLEI